MLPRSSRALLLLCAGILGGLGLAAPSEEEELGETWMRLALDETPVVQLLEDVAHRMGNGSSQGAAELQEGHRVFPSHLPLEQERPRDVYPRRESALVLQEVMEKLQRLNQSLELTLEALEDTRSRLENHLERLKAVPNPDGQSPSATSTFIPPGSYSALLVLLLVLALLWLILLLLLLFLAASAFGIPELSALLALAVAGQQLVASRGIRPAVSREKIPHRLTSTPERECDLELLQEELDRMEMSCVRGDHAVGDVGIQDTDPTPWHVPPSSVIPERPQALPGHVAPFQVSPTSAWSTGRCLHVLPEPSYPEQPQDIPGSVGWVSPVPGGRRTTWSSRGATPEPVTDARKRREPNPCIPRATTSLLSPRSLCQALTRAGQRCRKKAIPGKDLCHIHASGSSSAMDSSPAFDPPPPP
ncbi:protein brambleberry-like isoform X2 [Pseudopipra pipra]|uniref:protein brambleberry-like isoform X2 n=1 Tax=Pseudopipra pipra TaxID=415032 RepID=UPI00313928C6